MSEKLSMYNKTKDRELIKKGKRRSPTLKLSIFRTLLTSPSSLLIMHPGGEVNFRKRGSKFSLPLSHRHQTLHVTLREVKFTRKVRILLPTSPSPFPSSTHTRMRQTPDTLLSGSQVFHKGVYMLSSREWLEERGQVSKETMALRRWGI